MKDDYHDTTFTEKMNTLKKIIWSDMSNASDIILHEIGLPAITKASIQNIFRIPFGVIPTDIYIANSLFL